MKFYLQVSDGVILDHSYCLDDTHTVECDCDSLTNYDGHYTLKYLSGELISLTQQEIESHPRYKLTKIQELKNKVSRDISALDELKAHSLMGKVAMGGELSQDEASFVSNFLVQRQALLDQYELDKAQYE